MALRSLMSASNAMYSSRASSVIALILIARGERGAVLVPPDQLSFVPDELLDLVAQEVLHVVLALILGVGNNQLSDGSAHDLVFFPAEETLGRLIEALNGAPLVEGNDALGGVMEDSFEALFAQMHLVAHMVNRAQ